MLHGQMVNTTHYSIFARKAIILIKHVNVGKTFHISATKLNSPRNYIMCSSLVTDASPRTAAEWNPYVGFSEIAPTVVTVRRACRIYSPHESWGETNIFFGMHDAQHVDLNHSARQAATILRTVHTCCENRVTNFAHLLQ